MPDVRAVKIGVTAVDNIRSAVSGLPQCLRFRIVGSAPCRYSSCGLRCKLEVRLGILRRGFQRRLRCFFGHHLRCFQCLLSGRCLFLSQSHVPNKQQHQYCQQCCQQQNQQDKSNLFRVAGSRFRTAGIGHRRRTVFPRIFPVLHRWFRLLQRCAAFLTEHAVCLTDAPAIGASFLCIHKNLPNSRSVLRKGNTLRLI